VSNRWLRFVIALLAIVVSIAAGFRISQLEQQLGSDVSKSRAGEAAAQTAIESIGDLRAALHAYVAPSQSQSFWTSRAAMFTDMTRSALLELDGAATAAGAPVTEALAALDKLGKSEQRARNYLSAGQTLLAGDVIFTEGRDLLDAMRVQSAHARGEIAKAAAARQAALRREQWMLALGGLGILALAVLVLVPPARVQEPLVAAAPAQTQAPAAAKPSDDLEYARVISKAPVPAGSQTFTPSVRQSSVTVRPATASSSSKSVKPATAAPPAASKPAGPPAQETPAAPPAPAPSPVPLAEAAAVCVDLARLSDSGEISKLLERAASVLNASGIVVWMASEDRGELFPAAAAGYDDRLFSRIGSIPRDASNLTAAAFREGSARTSPSAALQAAALAVPLVTPDGPVGVLSAELKTVPQVDGSRLAVATIFAAQLSMLLGSMTVAPPQAEITQTAQNL
jgi:hypothetical protein